MPHPLPSTLLVFLVFSSCSPVLQTDAASAEAPLTGAQFGDAVAAGADHHAHPRLLASHERFAGLLALSQSDPVLAAKRDIILKQAKSIRTRAPFQYIQFTDRPRNGDSLINRAYVLALAYLVTPAGPDRDDLRDALWSQLDAVTKFPDWNPGVCLDTADFAVAFAISYDWLYDAWTDDQRTELRGALYFMGVDAAAKMYRSSAASPPGASGDWVLDTSNHNVACNSGFATAAMALLGDVTSSHQAELVEVLSDAYTSSRMARSRSTRRVATPRACGTTTIPSLSWCPSSSH